MGHESLDSTSPTLGTGARAHSKSGHTLEVRFLMALALVHHSDAQLTLSTKLNLAPLVINLPGFATHVLLSSSYLVVPVCGWPTFLSKLGSKDRHCTAGEAADWYGCVHISMML